MPSCYCLTQQEVDTLHDWVQAGGVLLSEAHLAGYNATTGRHSRQIPGCRLAERWRMEQIDSTSSFHLKLDDAETFAGNIPVDVQKALDGVHTTGRKIFPIKLMSGTLALGTTHYATLAGSNLTAEGFFDSTSPCIASTHVGAGWVLYCGTNLCNPSQTSNKGFTELIRTAADKAGIYPTLNFHQADNMVHLDILNDETGPRFAILKNRSDQPVRMRLDGHAVWKGLFTGYEYDLTHNNEIKLDSSMTDLFVITSAS